MVLFIISQVFVGFSLVFILLSILSKNKKAIVFYRIPSTSFYAASYALQGLWLAFGNMLFGLVQFFTYYLFKKANKKPNVFILILFLAIILLMGWLLWEGPLSLLMIIANLIIVWVFWQENEKVTRLTLPIVTCLVLTYNIIVLNYVGIALECIVQVFQLFAIIRYDILKKESLLKENV